MKGQCLQTVYQMWSDTGGHKSSGLICTGLIKDMPGDFNDRCHWWFEYEGTTYSEVYDSKKGKHVVVKFRPDDVVRDFTNIRKYNSDQFQFMIDVIGSFRDLFNKELSGHLELSLLLEMIKRDDITDPTQFPDLLRKATRLFPDESFPLEKIHKRQWVALSQTPL